jgi:hypothetical protein
MYFSLYADEQAGGHKEIVCLSWLTNSAQMREGGCGVSANEYSCSHGAQINFWRSNSVFSIC